MGVDTDRIFTGYDAVDNDYFCAKAELIRLQKPEVSRQYRLPEHYFLSVGRFVAKKNLETLVRAYWEFLANNPTAKTHLVLVGAGPEEMRMRSLCLQLHLPVYEKSSVRSPQSTVLGPQSVVYSATERATPGVHFYGFRQIEETPVFYALADAFVLVSLQEEWGLVVNEAMASGLPVVVSERAGCAEDLLETGWPLVGDCIASQLQAGLERVECRLCRNGFLFDPQSPRALASALRMLDLMPALREAMATESRRIVEKFSCANFAVNALAAARAAMGLTHDERRYRVQEFPQGSH
jgi:glycosyltransferase involved in cell wall biosynthesis